MEPFFVRYKNSLVLAFALMAQFVLLAVQVRPQLPGAAAADQAGVRVLRMGVTNVVAPPEKVLHQGGLGLRGIWSSYINLVNVKQQNQALAAENQRLQLEQAALAEDARQGERLQELLAFKQHYVETTVPAQVVGAGGSDHGRILYIDKGSDDGIASEMPVITPDGIVGRIRDVMPHTSQVLEISDPTSAAGVLLEETRTRGIVRGDSVGHAEIVNLMPDDRIKAGQMVLTSGGDQIFPRGLPVGVVDRVVPDMLNPPLVDVILKPAANLGRLEEVLVVTGTSATPSPRSRHDLASSETTAAAVKAAAIAKAAAAAEAALEAQRASDVLAARLPSAANVSNPDAPDAAPGSSPETADSAAAPLHPPSALHADHYSPGAVPKADALTPGERFAPYAQGSLASGRIAKPSVDGDPASSLPGPAVSPAFRAAHNAAIAARPHPLIQAATVPAETLESGAASAPPAGAPKTVSGAAAGAVAHTLSRTAPGAVSGNPTQSMQSGIAGEAPIRPVKHLAPDGTPLPAAGAASTLPRRPSTLPATPGTGAGTAAAASHKSVPTQIVTDGPLPARQPPANGTVQPSGRTASSATIPGAAAPTTGVPRAAAPHRRTPALVPDDGSRPPAAAAPAPSPATPAPTTPPGQP